MAVSHFLGPPRRVGGGDSHVLRCCTFSQLVQTLSPLSAMIFSSGFLFCFFMGPLVSGYLFLLFLESLFFSGERFFFYRIFLLNGFPHSNRLSSRRRISHVPTLLVVVEISLVRRVRATSSDRTVNGRCRGSAQFRGPLLFRHRMASYLPTCRWNAGGGR